MLCSALAKKGDLIRLKVYVNKNYKDGDILRVHNVVDMSPARQRELHERNEQRKSNGKDEEHIDFFYPITTDNVVAFPPEISLDVDIHNECFGFMVFLENDDYEVLTQSEQEDYWKSKRKKE